MRIVENSFHGPVDRRFAVDRAHRGDVEGAFGTIASHDTEPRRTLARRLATLAAIVGPGLIVLAADNDAGGLSVYAQAGQDYGTSLLWVLLLLAPVLFINQEMAARLGAVTGAGHARLIYERFGRWWGSFALSDLLVLNVLIVATDFIGMTLALGQLRVSRYLAVPLAVAFLLVVTAGGSFRRWERTMVAMVALDALLIPMALLVHVGSASVALPAPQSVTGDQVFLLVALVGTTAAPWQLFLQQSSVVDKRVTARWLSYARVDTAIGTACMVLSAAVVLIACAAAFGGTPLAGRFTDAGGVIRGLGLTSGGPAGTIFALVLLNASLLGAAAVTLSSAYAVGDVLGVKHSLRRGWADAPRFHAAFAITVVAGAAIALLPGVPVALITNAVQALAGALLPSACVFLLLLCNDADVLGPRTNPRWLNALGAVEVGFLMVISAFLAITTAFPGADQREVIAILTAGGAAFFVAWGVLLAVEGRRRGEPAIRGWWERRTWTMPAIETLSAPLLTRGRSFGLVLLRGYLLVAVAFVIVRIVETAR
ncbi:MAG TPA: NRAMP family divalent metal transporter [Terriglobales bacterium]|nr:NRAMP family divalent metal transporter [Terriglobales bacterium]